MLIGKSKFPLGVSVRVNGLCPVTDWRPILGLFPAFTQFTVEKTPADPHDTAG